MILTATDKRRITLKVLVNPLVSLLWMAGAVFAFGVAVAAWPMRRSAEERVPAVAASRAAGEAEMDATLSMVGVDRRTAAVDLRERIAPLWPSVSPQGAIPLTTCLRCETYMLADDPERVRADLVGRLATHSWLPAPIVRSAVTLRTGRPSVEHLFSVAAGLESPIVGERQILDQVRRSWDAARAAPLDARLDRLFQHAVGAGRRVRRDTGIGHTAVSLARTAAGLAAGEGDLGGGAVTVLGAGAVARSAALALADRGARRSPSPAARPRAARRWGPPCGRVERTA